jgi:hypothetical protein
MVDHMPICKSLNVPYKKDLFLMIEVRPAALSRFEQPISDTLGMMTLLHL